MAYLRVLIGLVISVLALIVTDGRVREIHSIVNPDKLRHVGELADLVQRSAAEVGIEIEIDHIENPRVEAEEHYFNPVHTKLLDLGLKPSYLGDELVRSMLKTIERQRARVIESAIDPQTKWKPGSPAGATTS